MSAGAASSQDIGPTGPSPYDVVEGWLQPFANTGFAFGGNSGVFAESSDRIFVLQRGETRLPDPVPAEFSGFAGSIGINVLREEQRRTWQNCIFVVDGNGNVIEVWDQWDHLFEGSDGPGPHRIRINPYDPERRVWVVHETAHQIYVLSNDGRELVMTLGERDVAGSDETHFGKPQDVAFLPDGRFLVADGYDNARVVIFDAEGTYVSQFGEAGDGIGQFKVVHSLAVGPDGLLFVADRDNQRIQVFRESADGEFAPVDQWTGFGLTLDLIVSGDYVWVSQLTPPKVTKLDLDGNWLYTWHLPTEGPNRFLEMHSFAVDSDGNLYGSDNQNGRTQKLVPKPDADPALLMGKPYVRP
jgi:DNA-binding beta-propeller fold protein YncE